MSSDSEEEDFVSYGTPLQPLEEDTIPKKRAITVEDQVAKDKHGRRRFHGAFTGGFSAGFFNTVGSLEGWKPSQFKSSRSSKSQAQQVQRPEDFMDEEDMDEFGIAPKVLRPRGDYSQDVQSSDRKRHLPQFSDGPIPGIPVLKTLIEPVRETIGIRLLKTMGWKPGQGVGPRLSKSEKLTFKKSNRQIKMYGCALPYQDTQPMEEASDDSKEEEDVDPDVTFAPDDFEPWIVKPKDDSFGLGYSGLSRRPVLSSHVDLFGPATSALVMQEKKKKVNIRGQAFGVGAFEREDEDIYATEDMSQYDFALDTPQMLAEKRQQERNARSTTLARSAATDVLEGFALSSTPLMRKTYPPPPLPPGFTPQHMVKPSRFSEPSAADKDGDKRLTAAERAVIVNEPGSTTAKPQVMPEVKRTTPTFRPFLADPEKQERYEKYLTLSKQGQAEQLKDLQPFKMTEWERERERVEFEQASRLYRPLSAAFSDRFVRASAADDATDPLVPVARSADPDEDVKNAAKLKMFGKLTRRISDWTPHNTLCKRFNIPPPRNGSTSMQAKTSRPKFSVFDFLDAAPFNKPGSSSVGMDVSEDSIEVSSKSKDNSSEMPSTSTTATTSVMISTSTEPISGRVDLEDESVSQKDNDLEKLADSTSKLDLYKAIFLSSSDDSDSDEEKEGERKTSTGQQQQDQTPTQSEQNILRNTSPPRGIFANLDFANLNKPKKKSPTHKTQDTSSEVNLLRNTSPPRGIFANLDLDSLKNQNSSKNSNPTEIKTSGLSEKRSSEISNSGDSEIFGPSLPCNFQNPSLSEISDKSRKLSNQTQSQSNIDIYGPSLPYSNAHSQSRINLVTIESSSDSEQDWVEMNGDSDESERHSSKKKHSKKSHRKSKKHKEKKHKHKKKRKK